MTQSSRFWPNKYEWPNSPNLTTMCVAQYCLLEISTLNIGIVDFPSSR